MIKKITFLSLSLYVANKETRHIAGFFFISDVKRVELRSNLLNYRAEELI